MIKELIKLASHLDSRGLIKEADYLDGIIKQAQYVESTGEGAYSAEVVTGPAQRQGSEWKDWTDNKKPGRNQGFLEGYDVNTSQLYTARKLDKVLRDAIRSMEIAAPNLGNASKPDEFKQSLTKLKAAKKDLQALTQGSNKFVMYQK